MNNNNHKRAKIIAIVPTFNSWKTLNLTVKSLLDQSFGLDSVLVIDNASTDGTSLKMKKYFSEVTLLTLKSNTGVVGGRNEGVKNLPKDYNFVLFFDHDMIADKYLVENLLKVFGQKSDCGIVTPKIYYLSDKNRIWSAGTGINLLTGQILFRGGTDVGQFNEVEEVQVAPAALLVKKEVLKKIRQFDNKYFVTFEDTDFCFRARKAGFKTFFSPDAIAYHDTPSEKQAESRRLIKRLYWVGRNRVLFMKDYGKNFWLFSLFIPVFSIYYLNLSLKFGNLADFFNYLRGTIDGLRGR